MRHTSAPRLGILASASIEQLEARQLLSAAAWLSTGSDATWNSSTSTLAVTGAATIIADPGSDLPNVVVSGSGAQLTIEPGSDSVVQLGSLMLSNGGSAEVIRPNASSFDPSSSLLVVVGAAGGSAGLSIDSASGSTLGLEDNDLIVRAGSANESAYLGGVTLGSPAVQPAEVGKMCWLWPGMMIPPMGRSR